MFVVGGSSSTPTALTYYDDAQSTRIAADGTLSPWVLSPNHLRIPRSNHSLVAVTTSNGDFLNVVAGVAQIGSDTVHLDNVEVARINGDCTVGEWSLADYHIKGGRSSPQALTIGNSLLVVGGWGDYDLIDVYDDVQISAARADGTPSPWRTSPGRLPTGIYGHATSALTVAKPQRQSLLLSVGGQPGTGAYANWISYAYVRSVDSVADDVGIWRIAPTGKLPVGLAGHSIAIFGDRLFVLGGNDGAGNYHSDVVSAQFDFGEP
jgi:hypothetical protein